MRDVVDGWWRSVIGMRQGKRRAVLRRKVRLSRPVVQWFGAAERTNAERVALAELVLKLDADPVGNSQVILRTDAPGLRWAAMGEYRVIFVFDPANDSVRLLTCM